MADQAAVMRRGDPRALLSAMLQRVQTEVGEVCSLRSIEDTDYATFFMKLVDSESPALLSDLELEGAVPNHRKRGC